MPRALAVRSLPAVFALAFTAALLIGLPSAPARAELPVSAIPEPLRGWVTWVLHGHEEERCTPLEGRADERRCAWPSRLALSLDALGGRFTQEWTLEREALVPLPGDAGAWPEDVQADGRPAPVVSQKGVASVLLGSGRHALSGRFVWRSQPSLLSVPRETGIVSLVVNGEPVPFPRRDESGRLWLRGPAEEGPEESRLEVEVYRRVIDEVPLVLVTRLELDVSGRAREALLGPVLPAGFVALALTSAVPARLEPDGRLRLQLRPGRFELELRARHVGPVAALAPPRAEAPWDPDEVWVFDARRDLRLVEVQGVTPIDPGQTRLPADWRALPAYRVAAGDTMKLVERVRGDAEPGADQLTLERRLWLDFDGGGYTIQDRIAGALVASWRLDMSPPTRLGRVTLRGEDQFLTTLDGTAVGVELREGALDLEAESRLEGAGTRLPVVGWAHGFSDVSATLALPPGWRLFTASGVDVAEPTWISRWTLLDLFLVLVTAVAAARLFDVSLGALALVALTLTWTEPGAPRFAWPVALAAEALFRLLPAGRLRRLVVLARTLALAALALLAVPFLVQQVRQALHPALEAPTVSAFAPLEQKEADRVTRVTGALEKAAEPRVLGAPAPEATPPRRWTPDPSAVVATGPGVPRWHWREVTLRWNGPVEAGQELRLFLLSPWANFVLAWLRVALVAALLAALVGLRRRGTERPASPLAGAATALALGAALLLAAPPARAELPSPELLDELRSRLLTPALCRPACASLPRLRVETSAAALRLRLAVDAAADTALPLPGGAPHWLPERVLLDGQPAASLARGEDGALWLALDAGRHEVVMEGRLPDADAVPLPLPLRPRRVETAGSEWSVEGIRPDGVPEDTLQLVRQRPSDGASEGVLLPPFLRVERTLHLGQRWEVETTVIRVSPIGVPVVLAVPLLAGESVVTPDLRVEDGRVNVTLAADATRAAWSSTMAQGARIPLHALETSSFSEVWRLDASPFWHVEASGIPAVHRGPAPEQAGPRLREWHPWPGEDVTLAVTRPAGAEGNTLTIDWSTLKTTPGRRASDVTLELGLRSSRGGEHALALPEGAELLSLTLDGVDQPLRHDGRQVALPLTPGQHDALVSWREPRGIRALFRSPEVDLGAPGVNVDLVLEMPRDRWTLGLGGPRLGPAVLFWSLLAVIALAAFGLGRVRGTPLRARHWFLLGVGLTQAPIWLAGLVVGWLLALGWRREQGAALRPLVFDLSQLGLALWTLASLVALFLAVKRGLLGLPEMQIAGNGSTFELLRWYQDRSASQLPRASVLSVPLGVYRLAMLAWALWLAQALVGWLRWAWECVASGGLWKRRPPRAPRAASGPPATA